MFFTAWHHVFQINLKGLSPKNFLKTPHEGTAAVFMCGKIKTKTGINNVLGTEQWNS